MFQQILEMRIALHLGLSFESPLLQYTLIIETLDTLSIATLNPGIDS